MSQYYHLLKGRKKAKIRNRYNQIPHLIQDTECESDKNTKKHYKQESQEVSPFQTGDHYTSINRHLLLKKTKTNNKY